LEEDRPTELALHCIDHVQMVLPHALVAARYDRSSGVQCSAVVAWWCVGVRVDRFPSVFHPRPIFLFFYKLKGPAPWLAFQYNRSPPPIHTTGYHHRSACRCADYYHCFLASLGPNTIPLQAN
jgi:hypothetical protein